MALAIEQGNRRLTAILLLVVAVMLVYLLCFHWFLIKHIDYSREISDLRGQLGRFTRVAAMRDVYEAQLRALQDARADRNLFLGESDFNEAAAAMSERLGEAVEARATGTCQIVSRQPVRPRVQERFEKVTVSVRMRCGIEDLTSVLYWLESSAPLVLVEELTITKGRSRRLARSQTPIASLLDVRFDMSGYLR